MQGGFASLFGARHRRVNFEGLMQGGLGIIACGDTRYRYVRVCGRESIAIRIKNGF
jgi:hypothetical protein